MKTKIFKRVISSNSIKPIKGSASQVYPPIPVKKINETTTFLEKKSNKVFILGGGPSLLNYDLSKIDSEDIICVNQSINLVKNPKYFITMDYSFFGKIKKRVNHITQLSQNSHFILNCQHPYIKLINGCYVDTRINFRYQDLGYFTSVIKSNCETNNKSGFGTNISEFCHGQNSGYCAIQFAILAGYTEIYLLGFDLAVKNNKTHFHNDYDNSTSVSNFEKKLSLYRKNMMNSIEMFKRDSNVKFYTLTDSSLEPIVTKTQLS